jgi:hypothetical protein
MSLKSSSEYVVLDPRCLLRAVGRQSPRAITLADGAQVNQGDLVAETHLVNEHLPRHTGAEPAAGWPMMRLSLSELARRIEAESDLAGARALYGEIGFLPDDRLPQFDRILRGLGFELVPGERPGLNPLRRAFWRNVLSLGYLLRFNARAARPAGFRAVRRCQAWMSRDALLDRYGAQDPGLGDRSSEAMA